MFMHVENSNKTQLIIRFKDNKLNANENNV